MQGLRTFALVVVVFSGAILFRVHQEHEAVVSVAEGTKDPAAKGVLLAEAARWSWPWGTGRGDLLGKAMDIASELRAGDPDAARAIAEEVRATLYAVRVGEPGHPEILSRANSMIVDLLSARDGLDAAAQSALGSKYAIYDGPSPLPYAGSALGFCFWLVGLWYGARGQGKPRFGALAVSVAGLLMFLGFMAAA